MTEEHAHASWQICLSLNHRGEYVVGGRGVAVPAESVSIVPAGLRHRARDVDPRREPARFEVAYFDFLDPASEVAEIRVREGREALREASACLSEMVELAEPAKRLEHARTLLRALGVRPSAPWPSGSISEALARVRTWIERDPPRPHRLADLARRAEMSETRLCREFRRRYGLPPHAYQIELQVRQAKRLLAEGASPAQAAAAAGFSDQSHLHRVFRRSTDSTLARFSGAGTFKTP